MTRRCLERQFLLRPSKTTNDVVLYLLAVAAQRYGIRVHAFCVMSNHFHFLVTDPDARLPAFHQFFDALVARAINASLGRKETFWGAGGVSAVRVVAPHDAVDKAAYALANPVAAGLVHSGRTWPGLWSDPDRFGEVLTADRPTGFFSERGTLPERAHLELSVPAGFESAADFRRQVLAALKVHEDEARAEFGRSFLGVRRVLKQNPRGRPKRVEPLRTLRPRIAARDKGQRIAALRELRDFVREYRSAWAARRAGDASAVFPAGTYLMRVLHCAPCAIAA